MLQKHCKKCNETKPVDAFSPHKKIIDGRHSYCKQCRRVENIERYHMKKDLRKLGSYEFRKVGNE